VRKVEAFLHNGFLYRSEEDAVERAVMERFNTLFEGDAYLSCRAGDKYAFYMFFKSNGRKILKIIEDKYNGKILEELRKED
jgi:hypothetical protein